MTLYNITIPLDILLPFVTLLVALAVYGVEVVAYYRFAGGTMAS